MPTDARPRDLSEVIPAPAGAGPSRDDFELVSFDCYGTLIDWESGILAAMQPVCVRHELVCTTDEILMAYGRAESAIQAGPYRPYREVLRRTFVAMAKDLGFAPQADELEILAEALPRWQPFPDTIASLRALQAAGLRLGIISNVDDDLFARTEQALGVEFDTVVTAAAARCYKPADAIFELAFARFGLPPSRILHAAQSRFHDVVPGRRLGMQTVHVVRDSGRASAVPSLSEELEAAATADWTVPDLAGLARLLGAI